MSRNSRSETIHSSALLLGKVTVTEHERSRGRHLFSGTRLKALLFPFLHWILRHTSASIALIPMRLLVWTLRVLYLWPGNPLRISCQAVCRIANREGYQHDAWQIYRQFLANSLGVMENYFLLHRHGIGRISERILLKQQDARMIRDLAKKHGGAILAVPHNIASAISGLKLNQGFPLLVVARNPPTIARTRITLEFFEHMQVPVLMVRAGNPFELSRNLFAAFKSGMVIAATLDNTENSDARVDVTIFGQQVGVARWAVKIACRKKLPVIPCYFSSRGNQHRIIVGEPVIPDCIETAVQHYTSFFEQNILADPASWAYLADKRWRRILSDAG
jgi:lauroyl/myristoyl acyltransferase